MNYRTTGVRKRLEWILMFLRSVRGHPRVAIIWPLTPTKSGFFCSKEIKIPSPLPEHTKNAILKLSWQR